MTRNRYSKDMGIEKNWENALRLIDFVESNDGACHLLSAVPPRPGAIRIGPRIETFLGYQSDELIAMGGEVWSRIALPDHLEALERWRKALPLTPNTPEVRDLRFAMSFTAITKDGRETRLHYESKYLYAEGEPDPWAKWVVLRPDPAGTDAPFSGLVYRDSDGRVLPAYAPASAAEKLSPREREILRYCALGYASKETAKFLGLSLHTVHNHRRAILAKLDAANIAEAIRLGLREGLVSGAA